MSDVGILWFASAAIWAFTTGLGLGYSDAVGSVLRGLVAVACFAVGCLYVLGVT